MWKDWRLNMQAASTAELKPIYAQINPEQLGADLRSLDVAEHYCSRLDEMSENAKFGRGRIRRHFLLRPDSCLTENFLGQKLKNADKCGLTPGGASRKVCVPIEATFVLF